MESRKKIVLKMVSLGMKTSKALSIAEIPHSTFYYKSKGSRKGKQPPGYTSLNGVVVDDSVVVEEIKRILSLDFIDYGYIRTTEALKDIGFKINKKKVYRLMKENKLLYPSPNTRKGMSKEYVTFSSPICTRPFELMEIDIKYIRVHGKNRNAYLITILDIFTRQALSWTLNWDMKTTRVIELINDLITKWLIPYNADPKQVKVMMRTDNGSQFVAKHFRNHLINVGISNEYIRPATPEQNGHIESFHNTLTKLVCKKYAFENIEEARNTLTNFFYVYNNKRIMKSILYKTPKQFFELWLNQRIEIKRNNKKIVYLIREKEPENQASSPSDFLFVHNKYIQQSNKCSTFY